MGTAFHGSNAAAKATTHASVALPKPTRACTPPLLLSMAGTADVVGLAAAVVAAAAAPFCRPAPVAVTTCTNVDVGTACEAAGAMTVDRTMLVTAAVPGVCALVAGAGAALVAEAVA